jgi:predicted N-acetyltransferase YhbS
VGHVTREAAPERLTKGLARHPIPLMLFARLAVDHRWQGLGVGSALLKDAMARTLQAAEIAGIRAFAVHAKDEQARAFHGKFDFISSPTDSIASVRLLKGCSADRFAAVGFCNADHGLASSFQAARCWRISVRL